MDENAGMGRQGAVVSGRTPRRWPWLAATGVLAVLAGYEGLLIGQHVIDPHAGGRALVEWSAVELVLLVASVLALGLLARAYRRTRREVGRRAAAEADAVRQRGFLETVLASIGSGIVVADPAGRLVLGNREAARVTGTDLTSGAAACRTDLFALRRAGRIERLPCEDLPLGRALVGEAVDQVDLVLPGPDGAGELEVEVTARPVVAPDGALLGAVMAMQDVTDRRRAERQLAYLASIVESSDDAIVGLSLDGSIASWNVGAQRLYGYTAAEVVGRSVDLLLPPEGAVRSLDVARELEPEQVRRFETTRRRKDGRLVEVAVVVSPLYRHGELVGVSTIGRDVTAANAAAAELRSSRESYRMLFEANPQPMWAYDLASLRFLQVNDAAVAAYGYSREQFLAMTILDIRPAEDTAAVRASAADDPQGIARSGPWRHRTRDGAIRLVEVVSHGVRIADRAARLVVALDVTDQVQAEDLLRRQATTDPLTGLPNRLALTRRIEQAAAGPRPAGQLALAVLNLHRFRDINDGLGHDAGDRLLTEVGRRLRASTRSGDLVARLAVDEFAVLAVGLPAQASGQASGQAVAEHLLAALAEPFLVNGLTLQVDASVGVAVPDGPPRPGALLAAADVALQRARRTATGWAIYSAEDEAERTSRLALVDGLRTALQLGQLAVHYQPKVDLRSGAVVGVEALARWSHPELGPVRPDVFIPLAEQTGLITPLTEQVLRTALTAVAGWRAAGIPIAVAVNVSVQSLHRDGFVDAVAHAVAESGVPARALTLEITEGALARTDRTGLDALYRLRRLGVGLSIDDFGTGFSAMAYLKTLPVTEMKIDKEFVRTLPTDHRNQAIVTSLIALGHTFGLTVVAEGVEDQATQARLVDLGCDHAQGYHLHRPTPAAELTAWLRQHTGPANQTAPRPS